MTAVRNFKTYSCCPNNSYISIVYTVHLKRRTFYYFFNLLVPCGLIGFLAVLGFTLPPESSEKLSLGATILFSLIVFLNMIGASMPANSDTVPLLGIFITYRQLNQELNNKCFIQEHISIVSCALSVVSTIVINLNLKAVNTKEVGIRSKNVFLYWLPWILRMTTPPNIVCDYDRMPSDKKKVAILDINGQVDSTVNFGISTDTKLKQQWIFIATVVDRLCLIISLIFTFVSIIVFLIYAF